MKGSLALVRFVSCLAVLSLACAPGELLVGATSVPPSPTPGNRVACPREALDGINAFRKSYALPKHLQQENPVKDSGDFDTMQYFGVLKHLSMEPGYVLDWVYRYDGMGGQPVLYARKADMTPPRSEAELASAIEAGADTSRRWLEHVKTDGTSEGYVEFVLLSLTGSQFYLYWHSNYSDLQLVCDQAGLEKILVTHSGPPGGKAFTDEQKASAQALDLPPIVEAGAPGEMRVQIVAFTGFGGFMQLTYTLKQEFPHTVLDQDQKVLVPYELGIVF